MPDLSEAERAFTFCITQCDGCSSVMASTLVYWPDCHVFKSQDADFILFTWAPTRLWPELPVILPLYPLHYS